MKVSELIVVLNSVILPIEGDIEIKAFHHEGGENTARGRIEDISLESFVKVDGQLIIGGPYYNSNKEERERHGFRFINE